jgi:hypothetical protein
MPRAARPAPPSSAVPGQQPLDVARLPTTDLNGVFDTISVNNVNDQKNAQLYVVRAAAACPPAPCAGTCRNRRAAVARSPTPPAGPGPRLPCAAPLPSSQSNTLPGNKKGLGPLKTEYDGFTTLLTTQNVTVTKGQPVNITVVLAGAPAQPRGRLAPLRGRGPRAFARAALDAAASAPCAGAAPHPFASVRLRRPRPPPCCPPRLSPSRRGRPQL